MVMTVAEWTERKALLKREICDYFIGQGGDKKIVAKACEHIKLWGEVQIEMAKMDGRITPAKPDDDYIADGFSPKHRARVADWINRYAKLHKEVLDHLEAQRNYGEKTCWARDDFEYEDWESTQPNGEIQVHKDHIEVYAFGFTEGLAQSLPKQGKQSVGKTNDGYKWQYPLSSLDALKRLGLPVLYSIDAEIR